MADPSLRRLFRQAFDDRDRVAFLGALLLLVLAIGWTVIVLEAELA